MGPYYVFTVRGAKLHQNTRPIKNRDLARAWAELLNDGEPWMISDAQGLEVDWSNDWPRTMGIIHQLMDQPAREV